MRLSLFILLCFLCGITTATAQEKQKNEIVVGPNYQKDQVSQNKLIFKLPEKWTFDTAAQKKYGLYQVAVPQGELLESSSEALTIAFQKKDNRPGLENLRSFFRTDLMHVIRQFPDTQFSRWQPSRLDPDKIPFMSTEVFGKTNNQPPPHRLLMIDAGDGYYSITITVRDRAALKLPKFNNFFNSIRLEK